MNDQLEVYQRYQKKPRFHKVKQIVTFYGLPDSRAGFYGVYKVVSAAPAIEGPILPAYAWSREAHQGGGYYYNLERDPRFDELRDRLIIQWDPPLINWVRRLTNKAVLEIRVRGRKFPLFKDYLEFSLTHTELKYLFAHPEAHPDWRDALRAVGGVYLVLAEHSGHQYVGSAYGKDGI
jgi:hypothetical protein